MSDGFYQDDGSQTAAATATPRPMTTPIKVEQVSDADRRAAFRHAFAIGRANSHHEQAFMAGEWDDTNDVLAFTAHRIAAEAKTREEDARIAEAVKCEYLSNPGESEMRERIATAIRSRIPETDNGR